MGQQQLILLVLATVIVGIAIVVGIRAFTENSAKANADAMMQDAVRISSDLQAWKKKPAPFGGQGATQTAAVVADVNDFTGGSMNVLGYPIIDANGTYENINGQFRLAITSTDLSTITGINLSERNQIEVEISGLTDADIDGEIVCVGGQATADGAACTPAF